MLFNATRLSVTFALFLTGCSWSGPTDVSVSIKPRAGAGLFQAKKDNKWGFIDINGQLVIPAQFDSARDFSEGLAGVCIGPCEFVKNNPKEEFSMDRTFQGKYGFIDASGKMVINPRFSVAGNFHRGLAYASTAGYKLSGNKALQYGYINKQGTFAIPEQFQTAGDFDETGVAVACVGNKDTSRCGYIDTSGKFVINPQFYTAFEFTNGLAMVIETKGSSLSYINKKGELVWRGTP